MREEEEEDEGNEKEKEKEKEKGKRGVKVAVFMGGRLHGNPGV